MSIVIRLDRIMAERGVTLNALAERIGLSNVNLSRLKTGKVSAVRFSTLERLCEALECQPGDILAYEAGVGEAPVSRRATKPAPKDRPTRKRESAPKAKPAPRAEVAAPRGDWLDLTRD